MNATTSDNSTFQPCVVESPRFKTLLQQVTDENDRCTLIEMVNDAEMLAWEQSRVWLAKKQAPFSHILKSSGSTGPNMTLKAEEIARVDQEMAKLIREYVQKTESIEPKAYPTMAISDDRKISARRPEIEQELRAADAEFSRRLLTLITGIEGFNPEIARTIEVGFAKMDQNVKTTLAETNAKCTQIFEERLQTTSIPPPIIEEAIKIFNDVRLEEVGPSS